MNSAPVGDMDALWAHRQERRRRLDRLYRRLNGVLFILLLLMALAYFRGLWGLVSKVL